MSDNQARAAAEIAEHNRRISTAFTSSSSSSNGGGSSMYPFTINGAEEAERKRRETERQAIIVDCIESNALGKLVVAFANNRVDMGAFLYARNRFGGDAAANKRIGDALASPAKQTTPLHEMCRSASWNVVRYATLTIGRDYFCNTVEPSTCLTPLHTLAMRPAYIGNVKPLERANEDSWVEHEFLNFTENQLARGDSDSNNVLHFLALRERGTVYARILEKFPKLGDARNRFGKRPSDMRVAQREHDIAALRTENTELRAEIDKTAAQLVHSERATRMGKRVDTGAARLNELRERSAQIDNTRETYAVRQQRLQAERDGLVKRVGQLQTEAAAVRAQSESLVVAYNIATTRLTESETSQREMESRLRDLASQLDVRNEQLEQLRAAKAEQGAQLEAKLSSERATLEAKLREAESSAQAAEIDERQSLANERSALQAQIAAIQDSTQRAAAEREAALAVSRAEAERAQKAEQQRRAQAEKREQELATLLKNEAEQRAKLHAAADAEVARLTADRDRELEQRELLQTQLAEHGSSVAKLSGEAQAARAQIAALNECLETSARSQTKTQLEIEELRQTTASLREMQARTTRESLAVQAEMAEQREQLRAQLNDTKALLESARLDAERQRTEAQMAIGCLSQQSGQHEAALREEAERSARLQIDLDALRADIDEKQRRFAEVESSISEQTAATARKEQEAKEARDSAEAAEERLRVTRRLLESAQAQNSKDQAMIEQQRQMLLASTTGTATATTSMSASSAPSSPVLSAIANLSTMSPPTTPRAGGGGGGGTEAQVLTPRGDALARSPSTGAVNSALKRTATLRRGSSATKGGGPSAASVATQLDLERELKERQTKAAIVEANSVGDRRFFHRIEMLVKTGEKEELEHLIETLDFNVNHISDGEQSYLSLALKAASDTFCAVKAPNDEADRRLKKLVAMIQFLLSKDCQCRDIDAYADTMRLPDSVRNKIRDRDDYSPFCQALLGNDPERAAAYIDSVIDLNRVPKRHASDGFTLLHIAVNNARSDQDGAPSVSMVELLVRRGANVNLCDANGRTPLHTALSKRMTPENRRLVVRNLMAGGANAEAVCEYAKLLAYTRELRKKQPTASAHPSPATPKRLSGIGVFGRLVRPNKLTQNELKAQKSSEAVQNGTPIAMARAIGDPQLLEIITSARYRRVSLETLTTMVSDAVEYQVALQELLTTGGIKEDSRLGKIAARYRYTFYRFSPYLSEAMGGYYAVFQRKLQSEAGVTDRDTAPELDTKVHALVERDLFYTTLIESRGQSVLRQLQYVELSARKPVTDDDYELDEEFEESMALLVAQFAGDEEWDDECKPIAKWLRSKADAPARRLARAELSPVVRRIVEHILTTEGLQLNVVDARIAKESASLSGEKLTAYMDALSTADREGYDKRRMQRNADYLYRVVKLLVMFQNALINRTLDVDDMISTSAVLMYPDAVLGAVRTFIEKDRVTEFEHMLHTDLLYGSVEAETIIDPKNAYTCPEYAAACNSVRALEWCLEMHPQRVAMTGQCNKTLVAIAIKADNPLVCVAIDHFMAHNAYWKKNRVSGNDQPNFEHYLSEKNGRNVLQMATQQCRDDLLTFCIKQLHSKLAKLNPQSDMRALITTFRTDKDRANYHRCLDILKQEWDVLNGTKALSPSPPLSSAAPRSPFVSSTTSLMRQRPAPHTSLAPALMPTMPSLQLSTGQSRTGLGSKSAARPTSAGWESIDTDAAILQPPPPLAAPPPPAPTDTMLARDLTEAATAAKVAAVVQVIADSEKALRERGKSGRRRRVPKGTVKRTESSMSLASSVGGDDDDDDDTTMETATMILVEE